MDILKHTIVAFFIAAVAFVPRPLHAQAASVIEGQLLRLDVPAKRLVIRTANGSQLQFEYTDTTVVNGVEEPVEQLVHRQGESVTIQYEKQETRLLALQVEVGGR